MESENKSENALPEEFGIISTCPDHADSTLAVEYRLDRASYVKLTLHSTGGKRMSSLEGGYQTAGTHTGVWEVGGLPSGVYILKLDSSGHNDCERLLLLN